MTNLWQTCTLVVTNLWQACCKLKLLSGSSLWIGRGSPVILPARSPDQSYLNFYLSGYMKAKACETTTDSNEYIVFPISVAAGDVRYTLGIVRKLLNTKQRRRHACIKTHGKTFEHRLWHVHVVMYILIKSLLLTRLFCYFLPCLLFTSIYPYSRG
ncbi:hypothetical protein AVEN_208581-1 [Araneus ventricosus]|uniref:Uncharacterized protein n=1 Tax=Araneus ventricosus TaxID=182803 RepID=A0A4Y2W043_ARAVE|nr:hypothetical protein AVEN_208581-1 [Araneus ventricosus]